MTFSTSLLHEIEVSKREVLERERLNMLEKTISEVKRVFENLSVQEVYITGSLVIPYRFSSRSDIDIAVRGLPAEDYFTVLSKIEESLLREVEIIELENCRFSDKIQSSGVKVIPG